MSHPAWAQDWRGLTGPEIAEALTDRTLHYATGATQIFHASGRTLYTHGEPSWGEWRIEADQYCSTWPPSGDWDCYDVEADGTGAFNFVDARGNPFFGIYAE